jgi:hypothetical protein
MDLACEELERRVAKRLRRAEGFRDPAHTHEGSCPAGIACKRLHLWSAHAICPTDALVVLGAPATTGLAGAPVGARKTSPV